MGFNNKKYIKSEKLSYLNLKNVLMKLNYMRGYKNIFIQIKGLKNKPNNLIKYLNNKINNFNKNINTIIINSYKISKNKFFGFKKIKAIKRKLKKKNLKN